MTGKDPETTRKWLQLRLQLQKSLGKKPRDLNGVLYLIGLQELGQGVADFSKEQKQDILHIAICKVLSLSGYYVLERYDEEGWPHWRYSAPDLYAGVDEELERAYLDVYYVGA